MIRILDLETQNHPYYGDKVSSAHHPDNYVVELGWQDFNEDGSPLTEVLSERYENREEADASTAFDLTGVKYLVAHNAMFEIKWFMGRYGEYFNTFYKNGGRVLCTQYAEYMLTHQTETYPSLDDTAVKYGGTHKVDGVKLLWNQGVKTSDIDPELLHRYLTGPEGDIANTARVFFAQKSKLIDAGMWNMFVVSCDALVAYAMMEHAGLYVNMDIAKQHMADIQQELLDLKDTLNTLLPKDLPADFNFSWSSLYHKSALLYGGTVRYDKKVSYTPKKYVKADFYKVGNKYYPVGSPLPGEPVKFSRGVNVGTPKTFKLDTSEELLKWGEGLYTFPGLLDITTLPPAVAAEFSTQGWRKGEFVTGNVQADGSPVYSTKKDNLEILEVHGLTCVSALLRYATLEKDLGTYYVKEVVKANGTTETKGALQFVNDKGLIHHHLNATATKTGRLSASAPNMQNIPRGDKGSDGKAKSKVKDMFTSRFGKDGRIIQVDYSALEVVTLAAISGDRNLTDALSKGLDMHCVRLAYKIGEEYEDVYNKCHDASHPQHAKYKQMRTEIKPVVFAAQYGATYKGLAYTTGVSEEFAKEFLKNEAELFPEAAAFRYVVLDQVEKTAEGTHQREFVKGKWQVFRQGYWQAPGGMCYSFREEPQWDTKARGYVMKFKETYLANHWNQGEASVVQRIATALIGRWLIKNDYFGGKLYLINVVHDALYLDAADYTTAVMGAKKVKAIMEYVPVYMDKYLGYNISHIKFPAEAEVGTSMAHGEVIKGD